MNAVPQSAITAQPAPSATVAKFLKRPARLLIGGEWVSGSGPVMEVRSAWSDRIVSRIGVRNRNAKRLKLGRTGESRMNVR